MSSFYAIYFLLNDAAFKAVHPKYKLIMTHTARRSGVTNMYKQGIPTIDIMKITGLTKESPFMRYIKISQEETANRIASGFRVRKPVGL